MVTVSSIGPFVSPEELPRLTEKGFRGAQTKTLPGQGLGLFLAKQVCDYHDIQIHAEGGTGVPYEMNGIRYAPFQVVLRF